MARSNDTEFKTLEIRKYPNRRYYDTTRSRHLSLEQIHKAIVEGNNVRVVDAKTEEDITAKILTQILLEYEPVKLDLFSNELLTRAIRVNDRLLKDFVDTYFRQAFETFCTSQKQFDEMLRQAHQLTSVFPTPVSWVRNVFQPWSPFTPPPASHAAAAPTAPTEKNGSDAPEMKDELAALRHEVSTLKAEIGRTKPVSQKRRKT